MGTSVRSATMIIPIVMIMFVVAQCDNQAPTPPEIIKQQIFQDAVGKVWNESYLGKGIYQIRGGWVYADAKNPTHLFVRLANQIRSVPGTPKDALQNDESVEIFLDYPENGQSSPSPPNGFVLVADFHSHPFPKPIDQTPDDGDINRAFNRDVPGIVYSESGIFIYGPGRRPSLAGPPGYPGNRRILPPQGYNATYYGPNPFPPLK